GLTHLPPSDIANYLEHEWETYFALSRCWLHLLTLVTYLCNWLYSQIIAIQNKMGANNWRPFLCKAKPV
uniref:hypothetical protein n=1 Tax=Providencia hangzhouensis TaxID=3031799 RepID=UPI0039F5A1EB